MGLNILHKSEQVADRVVVPGHFELPGVTVVLKHLELLEVALQLIERLVALDLGEIPLDELGWINRLLLTTLPHVAVDAVIFELL